MPITSQNFTSKSGSLEILKVLIRCGLISLRLQILWTVLREMFISWAMLLMLQRFFPCGGRVALTITASTVSGGIEGFLPRPLLSMRAGSPSRLKRDDHFETLTMLTSSCSETSLQDLPSARNRIISARRWSRFDVFGLLTLFSSSVRCSAFNGIISTVLAI